MPRAAGKRTTSNDWFCALRITQREPLHKLDFERRENAVADRFSLLTAYMNPPQREAHSRSGQHQRRNGKMKIYGSRMTHGLNAMHCIRDPSSLLRMGRRLFFWRRTEKSKCVDFRSSHRPSRPGRPRCSPGQMTDRFFAYRKGAKKALSHKHDQWHNRAPQAV